MLIMAERINSSRKQIAQAIAAGDRAFIQADRRRRRYMNKCCQNI